MTDLADLPSTTAQTNQNGGRSSSPSGRVRGSPNDATRVLEALMQGEAEAIIRAIIEKAKQGDLAAAKLVMDRILPVRKERPVAYAWPSIEDPADAVTASIEIFNAVAHGDLTPSEAAGLGKLIETHLRIRGSTEFEQRLSALENEFTTP